jgi:hypothetical protein
MGFEQDNPMDSDQILKFVVPASGIIAVVIVFTLLVFLKIKGYDKDLFGNNPGRLISLVIFLLVAWSLVVFVTMFVVKS